MSFKIVSDEEKLDQLAVMIRRLKDKPKSDVIERQLDTLRSLAMDVRARLPKATTKHVADLDRRMSEVTRTRSGLGYNAAALTSLAFDVMAKWAAIRQAMLAANGTNDLVNLAFRLGFEHAVEGGKEYAKRMPELEPLASVVLYFESEAIRQDFVKTVEQILPGMAEAVIPGRLQ